MFVVVCGVTQNSKVHFKILEGLPYVTTHTFAKKWCIIVNGKIWIIMQKHFNIDYSNSTYIWYLSLHQYF
jgi:hypothetical protein